MLPVCDPMAGHVGIAQDDCSELLLQAHHLLRRGRLRGLRDAGNHADILAREETLGDLDRHDDGQRERGEEHAERDRLMAQRDIERAPVARQSARRSPPR